MVQAYLLTKAQNELAADVMPVICIPGYIYHNIARYTNRAAAVIDYTAISYALIQKRTRCSIQFCIILTSHVSTILQLDIL